MTIKLSRFILAANPPKPYEAWFLANESHVSNPRQIFNGDNRITRQWTRCLAESALWRENPFRLHTIKLAICQNQLGPALQFLSP